MSRSLEIRDEINDLLIEGNLTDREKRFVKLYEELNNLREEELLKKNTRSWNGKKKNDKVSIPKTYEEAKKIVITWMKKDWNKHLNNKTIDEIYSLDQKQFNYILNKGTDEAEREAAKLIKEYYETNKPEQIEQSDIKPVQEGNGIGVTRGNELVIRLKRKYGDNYHVQEKYWLDRFKVSDLSEISEAQYTILETQEKKKA